MQSPIICKKTEKGQKVPKRHWSFTIMTIFLCARS